MKWASILILTVALLTGFSFAQQPGGQGTTSPAIPKENFRITSPAFAHGRSIPVEFTGDGRDRSPELSWTGAPAGTKSFMLICDDPDAPVGTWVHWVVYNINPKLKALPKGVPQAPTDEERHLAQGLNSWKKVGYNGPAPPPGKPHRYFFKLYALDAVLDLPASPTKADVLKAATGHVLGKAAIMGTYQRRRRPRRTGSRPR